MEGTTDSKAITFKEIVKLEANRRPLWRDIIEGAITLSVMVEPPALSGRYRRSRPELISYDYSKEAC
jgi:hypothetical protein